MTTLRPGDARETSEMVAWAAAGGHTLDIVGRGSKRGLGRPIACAHMLDTCALAGIRDYDPAELVLTAGPATPLAEVETMLSEHRQMLAFEPPVWRDLLASRSAPTLGGVISCNTAGPRRVRAGAPRDHFLGFAAVNGRGVPWKAGGRVVKNVTGYDMCKLQAGAYGTLSVLTEVTLRTLPRPETCETLLVHGLSAADAIAAMATGLNSPHDVSAAAHLPAAAVSRAGLHGGTGAVTALRLEGHPPSVAFRSRALASAFDETTILGAAGAIRLWEDIREVAPLLPVQDRIVWRICPTPSRAADLVQGIGARYASLAALYDWGGGLVWLSLDAAEAGPDCGAEVVRSAVRRADGVAMLVVAPDECRRTIPVFDRLDPAHASLAARVKTSFDPLGILNPGRMWEAS